MNITCQENHKANPWNPGVSGLSAKNFKKNFNLSSIWCDYFIMHFFILFNHSKIESSVHIFRQDNNIAITLQHWDVYSWTTWMLECAIPAQLQSRYPGTKSVWWDTAETVRHSSILLSKNGWSIVWKWSDNVITKCNVIPRSEGKKSLNPLPDDIQDAN
jgi:hypothetical protein